MGIETLFIVVFLFVSLGVVGLVLLQHGKGADAGAAFGSGASATVFGSQGSANFLSRTTGVLATVWFVLAMTLAWFAIQATDSGDLMEGSVMNEAALQSETEIVVPAIPGFAETVPAPIIEKPVSVEGAVPPVEVDVPTLEQPVVEDPEIQSEVKRAAEDNTAQVDETLEPASDPVKDAVSTQKTAE